MDRPSSRSFLVRLWHEPAEAGNAWHGEVESIQSGDVVAVPSLDAALERIQQAGGDDRSPAPHPRIDCRTD